jgi:predicted fused transcriptional regulator/phosphomethylpyrimidine kinase
MAASDDLRTFIREIMARYDRKMDRIDARMERDAAERRAYFAELRERTDEIIAEGRAGREALFRILDRMDGNGGASTAG